jgi:hypothetical protein
MKRSLIRCLLLVWPAIALAQYDYNDDFTKAIDAHYPPLVRLLITKGAKQNTQDARGDTPLMLAIRSRDSELSHLLMQYEPNLSLQNVRHHSAAIEAVLADDADMLSSTLQRSDMLQVAQAAGLSRKLKKRHSFGKLSEILGAPGMQEISDFALTDIGRYIEIGDQVSLPYSPPDGLPALCATKDTVFLFQGRICKRDGDQVQVEWRSVSNLQNDDRRCSPQHHFAIERSSDDSRNRTYLGSCGVAPTAFGALPASYDYRRFLVPELQ